MIKLNTLLQDVKLYEGLIVTRTIGKSIEILKRWTVKNVGMEIKQNEDGDKILINFGKKLNNKNIDNLFSWIDNLGWFISFYIINKFPMEPVKFTDINALKEDNELYTLIHMSLETKYAQEIGRGAHEIMYHISPLKYKYKIDKIGLIPKTLSKLSYHPERIYLSIDKDSAKRLIPSFEELSKDKHNDGWIIYKVDITGLTDYNNGVRFFRDPNLPEGIYTLSNIPPQFLLEDEIIKDN